MSFTGAEKLDDTGCWQAAAHCVARSFQAVCLRKFPLEAGVCNRRALPTSSLAVLGFLRTPRSYSSEPSTALAGQ
jgi:hypothetical protein